MLTIRFTRFAGRFAAFMLALCFAAVAAPNLAAQDEDDEKNYDEKIYELLRKSPKSYSAWKAKNPTAEINLHSANLSGLDLSGLDLSGANLEEADLRGCKLVKANLKGCNFKSADMGEHNDMSADFQWANLEDANFSEADLTTASFTDCNAKNTKFREADMSGATFKRADLSGADLSGADLIGVIFDATTFDTKTNLSGADMEMIQVKTACKLLGTDGKFSQITTVPQLFAALKKNSKDEEED